MQIHQGENQRLENGEHLGNRGDTNAAAIFPPGRITAPVQPVFHGPVVANQLEEALGRTALGGKAGPTRDNLHTACSWRFAFPWEAKQLPNLAPIAAKELVEIGAGEDVTPL